MLTRTNIKRLAQIEEGIPLWGCAPGSPAALAGLRYGDIILAVNGQRTRDAWDYAQVAHVTDRPYSVEFRRGPDVLTVTVLPSERPS